jgi:hypothetical protein
MLDLDLRLQVLETERIPITKYKLFDVREIHVSNLNVKRTISTLDYF